MFVERELEKMRVQNENTVKEAREEKESQMKDDLGSLMVIVNRMTETKSDQCKPKKKASRVTGYVTAKELSAPARGAQSFQETVGQAEETDRHQAKLTAELKKEDPRENHATVKEPLEKEERRPNAIGISQVVQTGRTLSQVRNIDLPYTNMSLSSREETKKHENWRASKDIRPKR